MKVFVPSPDQKTVMESAESFCILAGPGTGKSAMALELARSESKKIKKFQSILFISFSNAAVMRLAKTAGVQIESCRNLKFMTYHSLAWEMIKSYGRHYKMPSKIKVMDEIEKGIMRAEGFKVDSRDFSELLEIARKTGKVSFDLMLPLALKILKKIPQMAAIESMRFPLIIADEFQDTNEDQWELLKLIGEKSRVIAMGDLNQVIQGDEYSKKVKLIDDFKNWKKIEVFKFSHASHRCKSADILNFANCLIDSKKFVPSARDVQLKPIYRTQVRATVATECLKIFKSFPDKKIGILVPSANMAQQIAKKLKLPEKGVTVEVPIYTKIPISESAKDSFRCACLAAYNLRKSKTDINYIEAAKALSVMRMAFSSKVKFAATDVTAFITDLKAPPSRRGVKKPLYELINNAAAEMDIKAFESYFIDKIETHAKFKTVAEQIRSLGHSLVNPALSASAQMEFAFEHYRENREPTGLYGSEHKQARVEVVSMWKSKGREFDFVIMVVDATGLANTIALDTEKRLLYVAATRAKEWLGVIYITNSQGVALKKVL